MLYDTFPIPLQILGFVLLTDAGRRRSATDLHLDLRQPMFDLPLLLGKFRVQAKVLRLDCVQPLPEPLDLPLEGLVRTQQGRRTGRFDERQRVTGRT